MNPDQYTNDSELIELRLQLHHEKCRADNLWEVVKFERAERKRLEAEVERLTSDIQMEKENEDRLVREWQKANNEVYGLKTQVAALIDDQTRLKAECQARQAENSVLAVECDSLKADIERLTKAVMHSPAAQLKLKELEGKTTFEEINPDSK